MSDVKIEDLVIEHKNLIYSIINKYRGFYDVDDLWQVAIIGMMKAFKNFNSKQNVKFTTYAYKYILGEVFKFVNDNRDIRMGKEYLQLEKRIIQAREALTQRLMRVPSSFELSLFLEIDEKTIEQIDLVTSKMDSLDRVIMEDGKSLTLMDTLTASKEEHNLDNLYLYQELAKLNQEERTLLESRYFLDRTQQETAEILGKSQVQVSRSEKKILQKLKANMVT